LNINSVGSNNNVYNNRQSKNHKQSANPNFKGLVDLPGAFMQGLEKSGFIGSFLVQDTLGMTVPRTREGLYRDVPDDKKKNVKNWNFKEGAEVLIREALSGPLMMFTPVAVLLIGKKVAGKSSFTNSAMIKRLGNTLTETVKGGAHESAKSLKSDFYRKNITNIVQNTTNAADKAAESKFIDKAVQQMEMLDAYSEKIANASGKRKKLYKKAQKRSQGKLVEMFNDYHKTHSADFDMVNRVKFDKDGVFATDKAITGIRGYAEDALKNKNAADITEDTAKQLQNSSLIKRGVVNALAALSTIGSVSIVPMLYKLVNPVPPGSLANNTQQNSAQPAEAKNKTADNKSAQANNNGNVSFKGKIDTVAKHFEFNGSQLTPALMTALATGGLLVPRLHTAVKRAPEDPVTKEKDYSEVPEILTRDVISTGAVTFGVPMLSKAIVSSYENKSGFVLQNKPEKPMSTARKVLDKLNPFSKYAPYSLNDLNHIYGDINTTEKLGNFAKFVDDKNGSLAKIFNTMDNSKNVFSEYGLDIKELAKQKDRKAANKTIMDKMADSEFAQKLIDVMKPEKAGKANKMLKRARTLNSMTSFAATIFLVPGFLGIVLPKVVYGLTAKRRQKLAAAENAIMNAQQQTAAPAQNNAQAETKINAVDYSKIKHAGNSTFTQLKHS